MPKTYTHTHPNKTVGYTNIYADQNKNIDQNLSLKTENEKDC